MTESNKRLKTKRNIEEAMVRLLEKESFDQITTVELAQNPVLVALVFIPIIETSTT